MFVWCQSTKRNMLMWYREEENELFNHSFPRILLYLFHRGVHFSPRAYGALDPGPAGCLVKFVDPTGFKKKLLIHPVHSLSQLSSRRKNQVLNSLIHQLNDNRHQIITCFTVHSMLVNYRCTVLDLKMWPVRNWPTRRYFVTTLEFQSSLFENSAV